MSIMRLARSIVGQQEADAVTRILLDDGYLGMGFEVKAFESELADYLGRSPSEVACMNSGTAAVHLAVAAALEPGDEILVQSLTFAATFQAISAAGVVPVACEIDPDTVSIDLTDAEQRLTPRCKAIMPVHYASFPAKLDEVYAFAKKHSLRVIEDAAHAFGCTSKGRKIGSFGDVACFSFDGIKNITCGEGGMVSSSDQSVMSRVRDSRLLGVENDTEKRYTNERSWDFDIHRQGYRYHMSNIMAAIGRVQLSRFDGEFAPKRRALAKAYRTRLSGQRGLKLFDTDLNEVIPHLQPIRIFDGKRDEVRSKLLEANIQTGIHYKPNHLLSLYGGGKTVLPVTERVYDELLSLPLHPALEESDIEKVCAIISKVIMGAQ
jgi:dTDP-4-amino-4,6-dideoxygalactose transaminase